MARVRTIQTKFWTDPYVMDLNIKQRYLFLYFLTNEYTNMAGIYEISMRVISFQTGMTPQEITEAISKFSKDGKIYYQKGWVILKNFIKHQSLNPSIRKGIENDLKVLPDWLKNRVTPDIDDNQMTLIITQPGDSLSQAVGIEANTIELNTIEANTRGMERKAPRPGDINAKYFDLWEEMTGLTQDRFNWRNISSIDELRKTYRADELKKLIGFAGAAHNDPKAGKAGAIADFFQLKIYADDLKVWAKRKFIGQQNAGRVR